MFKSAKYFYFTFIFRIAKIRILIYFSFLFEHKISSRVILISWVLLLKNFPFSAEITLPISSPEKPNFLMISVMMNGSFDNNFFRFKSVSTLSSLIIMSLKAFSMEL